jgi:hypothetical protein
MTRVGGSSAQETNVDPKKQRVKRHLKTKTRQDKGKDNTDAKANDKVLNIDKRHGMKTLTKIQTKT